MKVKAILVAVEEHNVAVVSVSRHAACDGCHKQEDGKGCSVCTLLGGKREATARAKNTLGATVGDVVEVEMASTRVLLYAALVFLLPIILSLAGYFIADAAGASFVTALCTGAAAFVFSVVGVCVYSHVRVAKRLDAEIVRILTQH